MFRLWIFSFSPWRYTCTWNMSDWYFIDIKSSVCISMIYIIPYKLFKVVLWNFWTVMGRVIKNFNYCCTSESLALAIHTNNTSESSILTVWIKIDLECYVIYVFNCTSIDCRWWPHIWIQSSKWNCRSTYFLMHKKMSSKCSLI